MLSLMPASGRVVAAPLLTTGGVLRAQEIVQVLNRDGTQPSHTALDVAALQRRLHAAVAAHDSAESARHEDAVSALMGGTSAGAASSGTTSGTVPGSIGAGVTFCDAEVRFST